MSGLAWLNDLMTWLARWIPRWTLIKAGHEGVLFGPNGAMVRKHPGMCLFWPITHDLTIVSTRVRSTELAAQLHGAEAISLVILFRLFDPIKVLLNQNDVFSVIDDRAQAHLARAYDSAKPNTDICTVVCAGLKTELVQHGISVESVDVAQRGSIIPIKMLNDYAQHSHATLSEAEAEKQQ